ncbi:unnamed protein product [Caenorhabditis angaria]|uniref:G-protein coupled receptors family 1 profile domain-containing protein n=1 Tax=Caenorhabditis angaria TaxID=860376 RepID=A0A9P1IQZ6_9PELO|nr:unnamed protein product [Caenorhabditis angaria]
MKDQESSIYQITNHLYKITVVSQTMIISAFFLILLIIFPIFLPFEVSLAVLKLLNLIEIILIFVIYIFNQIVVPIQNLLIFLLAFQRFLLYFYPNSEKYIVPGEKRFKCIIRWLYSIVIFGNSFYVCFLLKDMIINYKNDWVAMHRTEWSILNSAIYIFLDFLVVFSSIFYICILISVRKITRLASSAMKTRPEKVIIYQTLVLIIVKLLCFPLLNYCVKFAEIDESSSLNTTLNAIYYPLFLTDVFTTPVVFQITYIFCNKTNLEVLLKLNFRRAKTWLTVFCGASSNSVDHDQRELYNLSNGSTGV